MVCYVAFGSDCIQHETKPSALLRLHCLLYDDSSESSFLSFNVCVSSLYLSGSSFSFEQR